MAAAIWIVRANQEPHTLVDGIDTVFINDDNLDSEATVLADTHAAVIAAGHAIPASGYFSTAALALGVGEMDADLDMVIGSDRREVIAA